jgi:hypothetical protein
MSVVFSGTNQGTFVSNGGSVSIALRSGVDWMWVYNYSQMGAQQDPGRVVQSYWQKGMAPGTGIAYSKTEDSDVLNGDVFAGLGFTLFDSSVNTPGPSQALTSISNAAPPVVLVGSTAALSDGDTVRIFNTTGAQQLGSIDFTIDVIDGTHFSLVNMQGIVAAAGPGTYRVIPYDPYFYPPTRVITNVVTGPTTLVTLSVTHNFTVGQVVRFTIPTVTAASFGMTQLNLVQATIIAVDAVDNNGSTNTITVDVNSTGFDAFAWPLTTNPPFQYPQVTPVGMNTAQSIISNTNIIGDSEVNIAGIGMGLGAGAQGAAGSNGDVIYWVAGKSYSGGF